MGVNVADSLTVCNICKVNKGTKRTFRNEAGKTEITERLQLVSTDLLSPVTPAARGNFRFIAKGSDHCTKFRAIYLILTKDKVLPTLLVKFVQAFASPLRLRLQHLRADGGGEFTADYYRDYCKTTVIIQQFSLPNTPEKNANSERDEHAIMDVARCMLNGAALPKSLWGKMAAPTVFPPNCPPNATISGNTPSKGCCSVNTSACPFCVLLGPAHMGAVRRTLR